MWQVFSKNLRNQRTLRHQKNSSIIILNYSIIAQKLPMIKQGVKTMNAEFIWTHALFQLTFIRLLLFLTLMPKSKKTLETSLNLLPLFKTSLDARVEGLVLNVDYVENRHLNSIKRNMEKNDTWCTHTFRFLDYNFSFCTDFLTLLMTPKDKKIINKALFKQSKQFLLLFYFLV